MKSILGLLLLATNLFCLTACTPEEPHTYKGFIVHKEYVPAHMSNETPQTTQQASYMPIIHTAQSPHYVGSAWAMWVANKEDTRIVHTDSLTWTQYQCGQRYSFITTH